MMMDLVIRGGTLVTSHGVVQADIGIREEKIVVIGLDLSGKEKIDASGKFVFPGVIDAHTHMAAPGFGAMSSDNFLTGTQAAASGGVTTIIDFTVGSPETSIPEEIMCRKKTAKEAVIDYSLHAEVIGWKPGQEDEFEKAVKSGIGSFKFYMAYGSLGQRSNTGVLYYAFRKIAELGAVAMVHAEDDSIIESLLDQLGPDEEASILSLPRSRPAVCEGVAMDQAVYLAEQTGVDLHVVHISSALGIKVLKRAKLRNVSISGETCPHYLLLSEDVYKTQNGHQFSVIPPLRAKRDQEALWAALREGLIDLVATDHCPFMQEQKRWQGSFSKIPYGLPGVETLLPLLYSEGVVKGRIPLTALPQLLSEGPARINGLYPRKGTLSIGSDADLVIFDPNKEWIISAGSLHMSTDFSPYEGWLIRGAVLTTISRGRVVYDAGEFKGEAGWGEFIPSVKDPAAGHGALKGENLKDLTGVDSYVAV